MTEPDMIRAHSSHVVWEDPDRGLQLVASPESSTSIARLIERTCFGTSGLRYRRLGVASSLARVRDGTFLTLVRHGELIGCYVLERHRLAAGNETIEGVYRSQLCVEADAQGQGYGRLIAEQSLAWIDRQASDASVPVVSYGCIESSNSRSLELLRSARTKELGTLYTQMVYRQWPRRKIPVERLDASTAAQVHDSQAGAYSDCGLTYGVPREDEYFAVTDDQHILAGAHARVVRISFDRMGQPWDFLSDHVFAHVGPARRRFNPRNFAYLKLDGVVAAPGSARVWRDFISTLLAKHAVHMAMFTLDPTSQVSRRLEEYGVFGRVARSTRQELAVLAGAHGGDDRWLRHAASRPIGIGPFGQ